MTVLVDQWGQPCREIMTQEIAASTTTGVRPDRGLSGQRHEPAALGRAAARSRSGRPLEYFELAELIEERDLHYAGVLGTRKVGRADRCQRRSASDDPEDVRRADMVREWLKRDELSDETFDILDAIGKGVSFTEIIWDTSEGQWEPQRLERWDPRWMTFDQRRCASP
jgi:phage gp29-like protein